MSENWHQHLKNKNREELVAAGKELFLQMGFLQVNIKDVCDRAGISRVTFYKHFQGMDELIFQVQMDLLEFMAQFVTEKADAGANSRDKLAAMLEAWVDFARVQPGCIKFILMFDLHYAAYEDNPELKEDYNRFIREKKEQHFLREALEEGIRQGLLRPGMDTVETAQFLFTAMLGLLQKLILAPQGEWGNIPREFVDMLIRHVSI